MGRRFDLQSRLLGSIPSLSIRQMSDSGKGAVGSRGLVAHTRLITESR